MLSLFLFISCSEDENNFYLVKNPEAIFIDDNQSIYSKGDLLWLNIEIPTKQKDERSDSEIDIYDLTRAVETFIGLSIFQEKDSQINAVPLDLSKIEIDLGSVIIQDNSEILGRAMYENGRYQMRIGIPLVNPGNYFLANSGNAFGTQTLVFNNDRNNSIQFSTRIRDSNVDGRFEFVVQE